jgi:hypothetical protein
MLVIVFHLDMLWWSEVIEGGRMRWPRTMVRSGDHSVSRFLLGVEGPFQPCRD